MTNTDRLRQDLSSSLWYKLLSQMEFDWIYVDLCLSLCFNLKKCLKPKKTAKKEKKQYPCSFTYYFS